MARARNNNVTPEQIEEIAEKAANKAIASVFMMFDVDIDKPESLRTLRKNLEWAQEAREGSDKAKKWVVGGIGSLFLAAITYLSWSVWEIFKAGMKSVN